MVIKPFSILFLSTIVFIFITRATQKKRIENDELNEKNRGFLAVESYKVRVAYRAPKLNVPYIFCKNCIAS